MNSKEQNPDLKTGYIYEITSKIDNKRYFGSTFNEVEKRIKQHINSYSYYCKGKASFLTSFHIISDNQFDFRMLEKLENTTPQMLHERERFYIENNECVNKAIPNRNSAEYYIDNSQKLKDNMNSHYKNDINNYRTNKLRRYHEKKQKQYEKYLQQLIINELK